MNPSFIQKLSLRTRTQHNMDTTVSGNAHTNKHTCAREKAR